MPAIRCIYPLDLAIDEGGRALFLRGRRYDDPAVSLCPLTRARASYKDHMCDWIERTKRQLRPSILQLPPEELFRVMTGYQYAKVFDRPKQLTA